MIGLVLRIGIGLDIGRNDDRARVPLTMTEDRTGARYRARAEDRARLC